ncbi:hypothetical protein BDM02DRAFT_3111157 [Thelephora ganbajun]|uniref:Uncharacterized protein n=1 Tax=Thelephora ganbajun TaxID=370292 RepID=A0ACB6ZMT5_THEGA|nr:hypothetical protein BDM02DRAFT_3111157 [Thelephora ganbajun]
MLYEKSVPPPVFKIVMDLMNLDVQTRAAGYYDHFPDRSMSVVVKVIKEPVEKKILILDKDVKAGEVVYTEKPVVAVLDHDLQETGTYCTHCLRSVDLENVVIPQVDRFNSVYCSTDCETRSKHQSQNLLFGRESVLPPALLPMEGIPGVAENRNAAQAAFADYLKSNVKSLPLLVARFAARQVDAEINKMIPPKTRTDDALANDENSDYDHMERLRYVDTEVTQEEKTLLSNVLAAALPGLERLLGDDRHDILKGKMRYNSIGVSFNGGRDGKPVSTDRPEDIERTRTPHGTSRQIGTAFYYVSSYLGHSCDPNVRPSFDETGTSELSLIALRDLKKGDELTMAYVDVAQLPDESVTEARRRRRQELARGWKFACECSKCVVDALVQTENSGVESTGNKSDDDLGVPLEKAKLEEAVARVEAQLTQAAVSESPVSPASEPTPAPTNVDDEHASERAQEPTA